MRWNERVRRVRESLWMEWKRALSYRKREWAFRDYPVVVRYQEPGGKLPPRFTEPRYRALILGWLVDATGDTKLEALQRLEQEFTRRRRMLVDAGKAIPRPGTRVPIQFVSQARVNRNAELLDDFIERVLQPVLGIEAVWISDGSTLSNFHFEETDDALLEKIEEVYGVDVSDIESGNIAEILERITKGRE